MGKGEGRSPSKRILPKVAIANLRHVDAVGASRLDGAFFTENGSKNHRQKGMISPKKAEVLARSREVPEQLKKLEHQVQREFPGRLGKFHRNYSGYRTDHFQVTFNKGGSYWKQIQNHVLVGDLMRKLQKKERDFPAL
jgi:hypothetical protein